ncbi:terminase family protein [bacterium]|nr:terminase family protein [bacterium]
MASEGYVGDNKWIPKGDSDKEARKLVWSTKSINDLLVALDKGYTPQVSMPFYEGKQFLRRGNIVFEYTDAEIEELAKCANDIVYFAEKYAVVMTDEGIQQVTLRDYQKELLRDFQHNRFNIVLAARQMGKTVTASIFNAWYLVFNYDKTTLLLANKSESTKEIIDKAKVVIENLPYFMKPGIIKYDVMNVRSDNGCRLVGQSTTAKSGIGFTIHNLYLDEFAHVHPTIVDSFYENVYPTLSASKVSRINITSTPNGFNKFYEIYNDAEKGDNEYKATRVDWWQHPDRDDAWYQRELGNLGSEDAFNRQYGNEFTSSSSLLLSPGTMKNIRKNARKFEWYDLEEFENIHIDTKGYLSFDPAFDVESASNSDKYYLFSVDIAEGNGGDYSVVNVFEVEPMDDDSIRNMVSPGAMYDFFRLNQVAVFRSNEHPIEDFAKVLYTLALDVFNAENVKMIIEYNTYGSILLKYLSTVFPSRNEFEDETVLRFKHRHDSRVPKPGLRLKSDNKSVFCQNFKKLIEMNKFKVNDIITVQEASLFGTLKNGNYGAQMGNDDTIMTCITATEFFGTTDYADYIEELLDIIEPSTHSLMEEILFKDSDVHGDLQFDIYDLL